MKITEIFISEKLHSFYSVFKAMGHYPMLEDLPKDLREEMQDICKKYKNDIGVFEFKNIYNDFKRNCFSDGVEIPIQNMYDILIYKFQDDLILTVK